jgi:hypothetical protein
MASVAGGLRVKQAVCLVAGVIAVIYYVLSRLLREPEQVYTLQSTDDDRVWEDLCGRFKIYVYDLPPKIQGNLADDSIRKGVSDGGVSDGGPDYDYLHNSGFGDMHALDIDETLHAKLNLKPEKYWSTDQTGLEVIMQSRLLSSCYRTDDPSQADLFYIPFYGALQVMGRTHSAYSSQSVDTALEQFVQHYPYWNASQGRDHVILFSRPEVFALNTTGPPNGFEGPLHPRSPFLQTMLKLVLERNPLSDLPNVVSVPYPSSWHYTPLLGNSLRGAQSGLPWRPRKRMATVTFIGGLHRGSMSGDGTIRTVLANQCEERQQNGCIMSSAKHLSSRVATETALSTYILSTFSMQPQGDSFTRKGVFDSLLAGCIPVYFHKQSFQGQYPWHITADQFRRISIYVPAAKVRESGFNIVDYLKAIPQHQVQQMQEQIRKIAFRLQYSTDASDTNVADAFEATIRGMQQWVRSN